MYKRPMYKLDDEVIDLGLKFYRDGLTIPYYTLLRLIDVANVDAMKSTRGLVETIDPFENLAVV